MIKKFEPYVIYATIAILLLGSLLVLFYILDELFNWNDAILGGVLGFIGSIIGGALTLIGVRWTLKEQRKQFFKTYYESAVLIDAKLSPKIVSMNTYINDIDGTNVAEKFEKIKITAVSAIKLIDDSSAIINKTEVAVIRNVEFIRTTFSNIFEWLDRLSVGHTDVEITEDLKLLLNALNQFYKKLNDYVEKNNY